MVIPSTLLKFQFTHPGRGATANRGLWRLPRRSFNSRTPGGVRLDLHSIGGRVGEVSIHAPREGCDARARSLDELKLLVSIHAPREGCDQTKKDKSSEIECFNSRTPGGVRRRSETQFWTEMEFQFTHPGRGATSGSIFSAASVAVSIHAPREGCDKRVPGTHPPCYCVSIHAPREGCDITHSQH